MLECFRVGLFYQGIVHDLSRFTPAEFFPYANYFYGKKSLLNKVRFNSAWELHKSRNKHHWEYWVTIRVGVPTEILEMPAKYMSEMICGWIAAGKIHANTTNIESWYNANKDRIILHENTRVWVEDYIFGR